MDHWGTKRGGIELKIGVIGIGQIGGVVARELAASGHEVRIANSRGVEAVREVADEIGAIPSDVWGAVEGVDAIVVSIPFSAVLKLPRGLFANVPDTVPVIDTGNYYPGFREERIAEIDNGMVESVWVSRQLGCPIYKAFNSIGNASIRDGRRPVGAPDRFALAVAGDRHELKAVVQELVSQVGFDAVDGGTLDESWRQQPGTPAYCTDYNARELKIALAKAVAGKGAEKRDYFVSNMAEILSKHSYLEANRLLNTVD
jgi:predicted dinucleotide-binding enzyme